MMMTATQTDRVVARGPVSQVQLPADARALSILSRIDYEDAFRIETGVERTADQWARAVFNDAPVAMRARLLSGWAGLGLKLAEPWSAGHVLGWKVRQTSPNVLLLAADSILGLHAELLFRTEPRGLLFATLIKQDNPAARAVWARITFTHQKVVYSLLDDAAGREVVPSDG
jgi:hypothetical protein